jgi:DNA invertase Pin-like site-specific DNA recombinase
VGARTGERFISPDVQEEQIRAYADARGLEIDTVFRELDRTGTTLDRALLQQALARIESGESGGLIVARLDRFARTVLEALEAIARIHHAGGEFISVEDGLDSSTPFGKAMMTILLALAELEVGRVRESWYFAQAHAVLRGVHVTGQLPFGYRRGTDGRLEPNQEQLQAVRHAYVQRGFGALLGEIAESLWQAGVRGAHGGRMSKARVHYLLRNPVYTGEARCGELINPDGHVPAVSRSLWIAAQDPRTHTHFNRNVANLLAGLACCAGCGLPLKRRPLTSHHHAWHPGARYAYFCRAQPGARCPSRARIADSILEPFVVNRFFRWLRKLDRDAARHRLTEAEAVVLEADRSYAAMLASLAPEHELAEHKRASARAWNALAAIARLALILELPAADELRERWPSLNTVQQRHILSAALDTLTIARSDASPARNRIRISFVGDAHGATVRHFETERRPPPLTVIPSKQPA